MWNCSSDLRNRAIEMSKSNHSKVTPVPNFLLPKSLCAYNRFRPNLTQEDCYESLLRVSAFQITSLLTALKKKIVPNVAFMQTVQQLKMKIRNTEPYSPWQNCCETTIGLLKKRWKKTTAWKNVYQRMWDYALVYDAEILSRTTRKEGDCTGYEKVTGDISEWCDLSFYDHV